MIIMSRAFVFLNCDIGAEKAILKEMNGINGVAKTMWLTGVYDIVAELSADSDKGISKIVRRFRSIANVRSCLTMIVADKHAAAGNQKS
jgi:hypothetical protein